MRKLFLIALLAGMPALLSAQDKDAQQILSVLHKQTEAWNRGNIDEFMVGYWNNDSLMFIGQSGVTYGYKQTLANYKKNYKDTAHIGKLSFQILKVKRLSPE